MLTRNVLRGSLGAAALATSVNAWSAVQAGQPLPSFSATDLTGAPRRAQELKGAPTVVVVMPSRDAREPAETWSRWVIDAYGPATRQVLLIALDLPFFISHEMAQRSAREKIPQQYWRWTWLGVKGDIQDALGIPGGGREPYVYAIDPSGRVRVVVHGPPTEENRRTVLRAWRPAQRQP